MGRKGVGKRVLPLWPGIKKQFLYNQGPLTLSQYAALIIPRLTASGTGGLERVGSGWGGCAWVRDPEWVVLSAA